VNQVRHAGSSRENKSNSTIQRRTPSTGRHAPSGSLDPRFPAIPLSAVALAVALVMGMPQQARADAECGPDGAGADTVTCTGASYGTGIKYNTANGLNLVLDNPAMVVQQAANLAPISLRADAGGGAGNSGASVTLHVKNASSITATGTASAISVSSVNSAGFGTLRVDAGTFSSAAAGAGTLALSVGFGSTGDAHATLNGGQVTNTNAAGIGLSVTTNSLNRADVVMTGGTINSSGLSSGGILAQTTFFNQAVGASIRMSGGSVTAGLYGLRANSSGTLGNLVTMSGGTVETTVETLGTTSYGLGATSIFSNSRIEMLGGSVLSRGAAGIFSMVSNARQASVQMTGGSVTATVGDGITAQATNAAGTYAVDVTGGTVNGGSAADRAAIRATGGAGGTLNIGAAAVINAGASGIAIREGDADRNGIEDTVSNGTLTTAGIINGSIILGNGTDTLTVTGGSISGNITGDAPDTVRFALGMGSFTYAAPYAITGMNTVSVESGSVRMDGSVTTPSMAVNGGTLSGAGTITGNLAVNSGGTLASGNSTGALTTSGTLTFVPGSTYLVQGNGAGAPSAVSAVSAGTLNVTGGQVRVAAGVGGIQRNTPYTILRSTAPRTGTFTGVSTDLALLTPTLAYEANSVVLTMMPNPAGYESVAETPNEKEVGRHLGTFAENPGAAAALIQQIEGLNTAEARRAFASLAGSQHASASQVASAVGRNFSSLLSARTGFAVTGLRQSSALGLQQYASLNPAYMDTMVAQATDAGPGSVAQRSRSIDETALEARTAGSLWLQPISAGGHIGDNGNGPALGYTSNGFALGYDQPVNDRWLAGGAVGYQRSWWDASIATLASSPATGNVSTAQAGLYASYKGDAWRIRMDATLGLHEFDTERTVNIGAGPAQAKSDHRGHELGASVQAEYPIAWGEWQFRPLVGARYARLTESGFDETGPSVGNLTVNRRTAQSLTASAGARFVLPLYGDKGALELRAVASHLFGDEENNVSARVLGQAGGFSASGSPLKRTALTLGTSVTGQWTKTLWGFADAAYEYRGSGQNAYQVAIGVRKLF
jgi:uncharacterized protein with beta-barrel porin domain